MIDTIEKALNPLTLAIFFSGLGILRHPLNHPRFCLSIFYMLIVWSVYMYFFSYVVLIFSPRRVFNNLLRSIMININMFVTITSLIITVRKHEKIYSCIKKLGIVDDTLEKLGTPKKYHKICNSVKWTLTVYFILIGMTLAADALWNIEKHNDTRAVMIGLALGYTFHVNSLLDVMFTFVLRHLHLDLCRIARNLNSLFGIQMTLQMMSYFLVFVAMFDFQYHTSLCVHQMYAGKITTLKVVLSTDMWSIVHLIKLLSLNHTCENVSAKAQKTKGIIHKLTNLIRFTDAREEIRQFALQISLLPLKFNGMGLFYFGYRFVRKFFIWVLAMIIFMLQMDTSPIARMMMSDGPNLTCY